MKRIFIICLLLCSAAGCFAQVKIEGLLLDSLSGEAIEFANIGMPGKTLGTVTDDKGHFVLNVPDSLSNCPIKFSMIGYKGRSLRVIDLKGKDRVLLTPSVKNLSQVTVSAAKTKIKVVGNDTRGKFLTAGFANNSLGAEMAVKIEVKQPNTEFRKFFINITGNALDTLPVFRLNIYEADSAGMPGVNILKENVIIRPTEKTGLIELDLKPYQIFSSKDVFLSLEWVKDLGNAQGLYFSARIGGLDTWFRYTSQDTWKKSTAIGLGLHAEIAY